MLSVKDINNKRFEQAKTGYKTEEVDDFLREIASDIARYQREKEEAEKKIEVLVESVREYKKDEEALKDALIGAQKQGRAVISEAQKRAEEIISDARARSVEILNTATVQNEREKRCLAKMQQEVSDFKANLLNIYKQHLAQITAIPDYDDEEPEETAAESAQAAEQEAAQTADTAVAPQEQSAQAETQDTEATRVMENPYKQQQETSRYPFDDTSAAGTVKAESKFGELKFGRNK